MSPLTKEQQEEIITRYQGGESAESLSAAFGRHKSSIHRVLKRCGIEKHSKECVFLTPEQQEIIIARYKEGELATSLAQEFGCHATTINHMLERAGVQKHDLSYVRRTCRGYAVNEHAFDELTPEASYWIGFLMADGSIVGHRVSIDLQARDVEHLRKFRDFLSSNNQIRYRESIDSYSFNVVSLPLCEKLAEYGIVPNKTFSAKAPESLAYDANFWRGVMDGDGHIALDNRPSYFHKRGNYWSKPAEVPTLKLVGSEDLMNQFFRYVKDVVPGYTGSVKPNSSIFAVATGGSTAKSLIRAIYSDASTVLDRKAEVAKQILEG